MVVSLEELACFDLLVWLCTGDNAASRLAVSQSKVSRALRSVSSLLGVRLTKSDGEWLLSGDQKLLNLERRVHQEYRWTKGLPLRIESQYYSGPLYCDPVPDGWIAGNFDYVAIHPPLEHLRNGVIDAWIACYPDVPEQDDPDLACFHLTRLPTHLVVAADHPLVELGEAVTLDDVRLYPSLALPDNAFPKVQAVLQSLNLWNLPQRLNRYDYQEWEGRVVSDLVVGYATAFSLSLFRRPQVVLPIHIPLEVGDTLVVKRDYASHPRRALLLQWLKWRAQDLARLYQDVELVYSE